MSHFYVARVASHGTHDVQTFRMDFVSNGREARGVARIMARNNKMVGRLKVSLMRYEKPRDMYAEVAEIMMADAPEESAPEDSIFPVTVVRVTPEEDPQFKCVRFHVRAANGDTIKNCKTKREADTIAEKINREDGLPE